jgi:PAS domain-containing protein
VWKGFFSRECTRGASRLVKEAEQNAKVGGFMIGATQLAAILDSLRDPILFADTEHVTRYMNKAAIAFYEEGESLIGRSLLDCHNERSQQMMIEILAEMQGGLEERLITDNEEHRIYMRAVREADGTVLGYYERYEPPRADREVESTGGLLP